MTTFLRFFILALTPLLGVTGSFGPALLYGLTSTLVLAGVASLVHFTRDKLKDVGLLWSVLGLAVVLVTLVDLVTSLWLPGVRAAWGIYLNLLAFSPLVVLFPQDRAPVADFGTALARALKTGLLLTALFTVMALVREALGQGTLTLVPQVASWPIPGLNKVPLTILATGAGGFFLAAVAVVVYRTARPRLGGLAPMVEQWGTGEGNPDPATPALPIAQPEVAAKAVPVTKPAPVPPKPIPPVAQAPAPTAESAEEWGESLVGAVAALASTGSNDRRRLLVIGSGNGELAFYLSMLCLDQSRADRGFTFRIRGVDHFSTRVEAAIRGVYRDHQIEFIPKVVRDTWMVPGDEKFTWKVGGEPRLHVQFEVADFRQGQIFFPQPAHLIVLNQGIEYVTDDKKAVLLKTVCDNLVPGGALVVPGPFKRELLPEGMKRTGTTVFRKA